MNTARELELPLGELDTGELAHRRLEHLNGVTGVDPATLLRLTRAYESLAAIYAAPEADLARLLGSVAAARIRWFLDAPLAMSAVTMPTDRAPFCDATLSEGPHD